MKTVQAIVLTLDEVKEMLLDFFTTYLEDKANTRDLICQHGGIGKAIPALSDLQEGELIRHFMDCDFLVDKVFDNNPCQVIYVESLYKRQLWVIANREGEDDFIKDNIPPMAVAELYGAHLP
jgi:hypothetical protein